MHLGIFAKTFAPAPLPAILDAIAANGLSAVHFNMACTGLPSMPDKIIPTLCQQIRDEFLARRLEMVGVSGTYNMIHPNTAERARGLRRLETLAAACRPMGTTLISLCTGTRDPDNQWHYHPDNVTPAAWDDLTAELEKAIHIAQAHDILLGLEPELANVVNSAEKAQQLLTEMHSDRLKIILDPANLLPAGTLPRQRQIIDDAFGRLASHLVMAHAKDITPEGHTAAGTGQLDYPYYIQKLRQLPSPIPLIIHGLTPSELPHTLAFLQNLIS